MQLKRKLITLIGLTLVILNAQAAHAQRKPVRGTVDPEAMRILRSMSDLLGGLKQFSCKIVNMREDLTRSGHRVDYEVATQATISRPNKLKAVREGHLIDQEVMYNGTSLVIYHPRKNLFARVDAPETIDATLRFARTELGIGYPAADLFYSDTFPLLTKGVISATVIGKEMIAGHVCDHLLFTLPGVDFQIWIADRGDPLPFKYIVTDTRTRQLLSIVAVLSGWNLSDHPEDSDFNFTPPSDVREIPFRMVDTKSMTRRTGEGRKRK
jgi:hypothetical protein